jgi:transcriptional regulator GlxA family with amidase domain
MAPPARPYRVGLLAYDGCLGTEIFAVADLLLFANRIAAATSHVHRDLFQVTVAARRARDITTAAGFTVGAIHWHRDFDTLIVPGFELRSPRHLGQALTQCHPEIAYIKSAATAGIPVAAVCVGAFLLGEAGLLDGRRATTSWLFAEQLRRRYPQATVNADLMIATDGAITTTAAFSAAHDLALQIIRAHAGDDLARQVARLSLVADNRNSQAPYIDHALLEPGAGTFAQPVKKWLAERLAQPYDLGALAQAFHVSTRTMLRRFRSDTGQSPLDYLQQARVDTAKRLLESSDHTITSAMEHVGYTDPASFRRLFTTRTGVTPAAYQRQFRVPPGRAVR